MPAELWRPSLDLALHRNRSRPEMRLVQLATVRPDGRPAIRTVVFRGFLDDPRKLAFATDSRSAKRAEIEANPRGEICWYFPETREQFRVSGMLALIGPVGRAGRRGPGRLHLARPARAPRRGVEVLRRPAGPRVARRELPPDDPDRDRGRPPGVAGRPPASLDLRGRPSRAVVGPRGQSLTPRPARPPSGHGRFCDSIQSIVAGSL